MSLTAPTAPRLRVFGLALYLLAADAGLAAQQAPQFTDLRLTNREVLLKLSAPTGLNYRIDASTNLPSWNSLLTLQSTGVNQHLDSATPYLPSRFYRAEQLTNSSPLTGDHLVTTNGDVVIHPINHASFVMSWNGKMIYNDPVGAASLYAGIPRAHLVLISHGHSDHFLSTTLNSITGVNAVIIAPQAVYNSMSTALRNLTTVMANGATTTVLGLGIEAVPAWNGNHALGTGNGYVLTMGGRRIYMAGDTGNIAEMRALPNIDVAFLCMNTPFTMTANDATNAVRAFRPKVVYPYHYRDQSGATTNASFFKQLLGTDLGIEVRLRKWY